MGINLSNNKFLQALLKSPREMGSVTPSSDYLAGAMTRHVNPKTDRVLELGPGTGVISKKLIANGLPQERLILLEKSQQLALALHHFFPQTQIISGDASQLSNLIPETDYAQIDCTISSLPLLNFSANLRKQIIEQVFLAMKPAGRLVQFTYSPFAPISPELAKTLKIKGTRTDWIIRNIPPATVWLYESTHC
jgi:phosphatidylethanolamine/phosphatidyl-N-methylethanolamine N-methyltransferase